MSGTTETKGAAIRHVEESHTVASLNNDVILQREQRDARELQEEYNLPMKDVLESHLDADPKVVRRIMRKVDLRLIPILSLLYMWAFIDRSNLGNVRNSSSRFAGAVPMLTLNDAGKHCWAEQRPQNQHKQSVQCPGHDILRGLLSGRYSRSVCRPESWSCPMAWNNRDYMGSYHHLSGLL